MKLKFTLLMAICTLFGISANAEIYSDSSIKNFEVSYKVSVENIGHGFLFGAQDEQNFYMWQITTREEGKLNFKPHVCANGAFSVLADRSIAEYVKKAGPFTEYEVKMVVTDGSNLKTYVDGALVDEEKDVSVPFSTVGIRMSQPETACFDDITLKIGGKTVFFEGFEGDTNAFGDWGVVEEREDGKGYRLYFAGQGAENRVWADFDYSGVNGVAADAAWKAVGGAGKIVVTGAEGQAVEVYSLAGQQVAKATGDVIVDAQAGAYIVKVADKCQKVLVK